jgi:AsmA protein
MLMHNVARPTTFDPPDRDPRRASRPRPPLGTGERRREPRSWRAFALWALVAVVCLVIGGGTFVIVAAPVDLVREHLVQQFKARTGHDLIIGGSTSVRLWPRFAVSLTDIVVPQSVVDAPPLVRIASIEAEVRPWSLLSHRVELERVLVHQPEIELSVDSDGRRSWDFGRSASTGGRTGPSPAPSTDAGAPADSGRIARMAAPGDISQNRAEKIAGRLASLELRVADGALRYRNARTAAQADLSAIDLVLTTGDANAPVSFKGSLAWRGETISAEAEVASLKELLTGETSPVSLKLSSPRAEAGFQGRMATAGGARLEGALTVRSPDLRRLAELAGTALPESEGFGAFALSGKLALAPGSTQLAGATLSLASTTARGLFSLEQGATRPHLTADLEIDCLDINAYQSDRRGRSGGTRQGGGAGRMEGPSEDALDLSLLTRMDADVRLALGSLIYKDVKLGRTAVSATLADGVLKTNVREAELYGGRGSGTVDLDVTGPVPAFETNIALEGVAAQAFLEDRAGFDGVDGKAHISVALAGQGHSERQMVESLHGAVDLKVRDGALVGIDIPRMIRTLKEGRIPSFERAPNDRTEFSQLSATFKLENGLAKTSDLKLVSQTFGATGSGTTDLVRRQIDYAVRAHLAPPPSGQGGTAQALAGLELPLRITGPWRSPKVAADLNGIVKNPDRVVDTAKEIGRQFKGKSIEEAVRGLLGKGTEEENASGQKAKELLKGLLR